MPEHVHLDAGRHQRDDRVHVLRDARRRVQGDRGPDRVDVLLRDAVASQEVTGGIRAVDLEALMRAAVLMRSGPCRGTSRRHKAVRDRT